MKNVHPIELMLAAALVVAESVLILVIAAATLFNRPTPARPALPPARPPAPPMGSQLLAHLEGLTCAQLRAIAGTTHRLRKAELVALVGAMPI